ncbi:MAG: hypothetical protein ACT4QD_09260 [Acidobacteriota bacterium]
MPSCPLCLLFSRWIKADAVRAAVATALCLALVVWSLSAQVRTPPQGVLLEPIGQSGEAVYPAFEGWGPTKDGGQVMLLGYFNRNKDQQVEIPIGPNNRIEPGGPDFGQPTVFHTGRQYGVFAIPIPKDFGNKRLTWTLVANGHTSTVAFWTNPPYWIDFYKNLANGNEPPRIKFGPTGPELMGPPRERIVQTLTGTVGQPLTLRLWAADQPPTTVSEATPPGAGGRGGAGRGGRGGGAEDPPPAIIGGRVLSGGLTPSGGGAAAAAAAAARERRGDIRVIWKKYRGQGDVKVADETIALVNDGDATKFLEAVTTATFSAQGEYWLRAQINDSSGDGGGGDQCCWTTAHVVVQVK